MRKIALDVGDVRIGIATSDPMGIIASGFETYTRSGSKDKDFCYLCDLIKSKECDTVIVGMPYNMDGTEGPRALLTREFVKELSQYTTAKIVLQDERLTTVSAERMLIEGGVRRDKRKQVVDKVAATIILQTYLSRY